MKYKELGKTGIKVSRLCFGTLTVSPLQSDTNPDRAAEIMTYAFSKGVNFLDTAELYNNYPHIQKALKSFSKNNEIVVASKTYAYEKETALKAVENARKSLDRDVIDIFMLHEQESIYTLKGHMKALEALYTLKSRGVIRAVGASMHHVAAVYGAIETKLDVIHPILNIAGLGICDGTKEDMENAVKQAVDSGIGAYGMKAIGGGNLFSSAPKCLKYALSLPFFSSIAVGMQREEEVDANVFFFEKGHFPDGYENKILGKRRKIHIDSWCKGCGKCVGACSHKALEIKGGRVVCDSSRCVLCGYCSKKCEDFAIKIV